jgi:arsenate reductase (thioredoxin)
MKLLQIAGSLGLLLLASCTSAPLPPHAATDRTESSQQNLLPALQEYAESARGELSMIDPERKTQLDSLAAWIKNMRNAPDSAQLVFICTHNSRRSHMAQLWAMAAASFYGIDRISAYSAGTEVTAFNPRSVAALSRAGFEIRKAEAGDTVPQAYAETHRDTARNNPLYAVKYAPKQPPGWSFSKDLGNSLLPRSGFCAVMTCSDADKACPAVNGASKRLALPYEDPKISDNTPEENAAYDSRCRQIAREMMYVMGRVSGQY